MFYSSYDEVWSERELLTILYFIEANCGCGVHVGRLGRNAPSHVKNLKVDAIVSLTVSFESRVDLVDEVISFGVVIYKRAC
jgi:hypothetical protein